MKRTDLIEEEDEEEEESEYSEEESSEEEDEDEGGDKVEGKGEGGTGEKPLDAAVEEGKEGTEGKVEEGEGAKEGDGEAPADGEPKKKKKGRRRKLHEGGIMGNRMTFAASEMTGKLFGKELSQYDEVDVDTLLEQLSPEELELLAGDVDPDDSLVPPQDRCGYKCAKDDTGPLDRKQLINHINEQAINEPDVPELVPYVAGTLRGKKWVPPPPPEAEETDEQLMGVEIDLDDEFNGVLEIATEDEIVDLAAVLGFHSMMNQDQYHASLLNKERPQGMGWGGITKATKFKPLPAEPPNDTDPESSIERIKQGDAKLKELNLNNIRNMSDEQIVRLFSALEGNCALETLCMANTGLSDRHLDALTSALGENTGLRTINLETNNISPTGVVRVVSAINKQHSCEDVRLANQQQSVLGNKIEMELTHLIEQNHSLLRLGVHFEFNDARNRVSRQLQTNLDTFREKLQKRRAEAAAAATLAASLSVTVPARTGDSDDDSDSDSDDDSSSSSSGGSSSSSGDGKTSKTDKTGDDSKTVDDTAAESSDEEEEADYDEEY